MGSEPEPIALSHDEFPAFFDNIGFPVVFVPLFANNAFRNGSCLYHDTPVLEIHDVFTVGAVLLLVRRTDLYFTEDENKDAILQGIYDVSAAMYHPVGSPLNEEDRHNTVRGIEDALGYSQMMPDAFNKRVLVVDLELLGEDNYFPETLYDAFFHRLDTELEGARGDRWRAIQDRHQQMFAEILGSQMTEQLLYSSRPRAVRLHELETFFEMAQRRDRHVFANAFAIAAPFMSTIYHYVFAKNPDAFMEAYTARYLAALYPLEPIDPEFRSFLIRNTAFMLPYGDVMFPYEAERWVKSRRCTWITGCLQQGFMADSEEARAGPHATVSKPSLGARLRSARRFLQRHGTQY